MFRMFSCSLSSLLLVCSFFKFKKMRLTFLVCVVHVLDFIIAHPINGNPAQNQRNCILMTSQKEKELDAIVRKLAEFINTIHDEHEEFDITLLKLDIEQHIEDDEEEKDTILQITVNDCAETHGIHQDGSGNDKKYTGVSKKDFKDDQFLQNTKNSLETENISTEGHKDESPITESSQIKHEKIKKMDQDSLKNENDSLEDENEETLKLEDLKAEKEKPTTEIIENEHLNEKRETNVIEGDNDILGSSDVSIRKNVRDQTVNVNPTNLRGKENCNIVKPDKKESPDDNDEEVEENKEHIGKNFVKVKDGNSQKDEVNESDIEISRKNEVFKSKGNDEIEDKAKGTTEKNKDTEKEQNKKNYQQNFKNKENFNKLNDQANNRVHFLKEQSFKEHTKEDYKEFLLRSDELTQAVEEDLYGRDLLEDKDSTSEASVIPEIMILELQDNGNKLLQELRKRRRKVTPFLVFVQRVQGKDEYLFL